MPRSFLLFLFAAIVVTSCSTNNVTVDDSLKTYFDSARVHGDFGLYDNQHGHFTIYNLKRFRDSAYQPGETFDIVQALIALQTGVVANENSAIISISQDLTGAGPNDSHSLKDIFGGWGGPIATMALAETIGKDTLKKWVDSLHYGNRDISGYFDTAQSPGRLTITADEQLGLIKRLYFDQLPFFQRPQKITKSLFHTEQNSNYLLTYKTGSWVQDGKTVAWVLGWVEENKHPYFFVLNFETGDRSVDVPTAGLQLVKKILAPLGFFVGKK
jgi:beta-lactamase class D